MSQRVTPAAPRPLLADGTDDQAAGVVLFRAVRALATSRAGLDRQGVAHPYE